MHDSNRNKYLGLWLLVTLAVSACEEGGAPGFQPGDVFPRHELTGLIRSQGGQLKLGDKALLVNFWATWCGPCRREMPSLQGLSEAVDNQRVLVIGVSVDEDKNLMQEFLLQHEIRFPNFQDADRKLAGIALGIQVYPETYVVSPEGKIIARIKGERAWNSPEMRDRLNLIGMGKTTRLEDFS